MTEFTDGGKRRCSLCGQKYYPQEGKVCDCWTCSHCGEMFSDFDMLANRELWLCIPCEDERAQKEGALTDETPY